ncbi:hypothetical protein B0H19DRAFT_1235888 [Mycena capillaripes]|nr:hypothetical protein B0H19DRAFT_1235888 [Mycena capillaripes]
MFKNVSAPITNSAPITGNTGDNSNNRNSNNTNRNSGNTRNSNNGNKRIGNLSGGRGGNGGASRYGTGGNGEKPRIPALASIVFQGYQCFSVGVRKMEEENRLEAEGQVTQITHFGYHRLRARLVRMTSMQKQHGSRDAQCCSRMHRSAMEVTPGAKSDTFDLICGGRIQSAFDVTVQSLFVTTKPGFVLALYACRVPSDWENKACTKPAQRLALCEEHFNGEPGGQHSTFSELNSYQQTSQRRENSEYHSTRKSDKLTKNFESSEPNRSTRRTRGRNLADCDLALQVPILTISPKSSSDFQFNPTEIDLDDYVGDIDGELVWGGDALKFSDSCPSIRLEGTFLLATSLLDETERKLNLEDHIAYMASRRCFEAVTPDLELAELMSSAKWMDLTVVARPDMRNFLRDPAFQKAVSRVVRRAVEEVMSEVKEEMIRAVEQAVTMVAAGSHQYVDSEMDALARVANKTTAYTGLGQLTMMGLKQLAAFNEFAPKIGAIPIIEEMNTYHGESD